MWKKMVTFHIPFSPPAHSILVEHSWVGSTTYYFAPYLVNSTFFSFLPLLLRVSPYVVMDKHLATLFKLFAGCLNLVVDTVLVNSVVSRYAYLLAPQHARLRRVASSHDSRHIAYLPARCPTPLPSCIPTVLTGRTRTA